MMNMDGGPYMWMWFHTKIQDTVLFDTWNITDVGTLVWAAVLIILTGVIVEGIKYLRWKLQKYKPMNPRKPYAHRLFSAAHFAQTFLFLLQLVLSYCLMLIFMTFSVWLGLAVVIGLTIGYLTFGARE